MYETRNYLYMDPPENSKSFGERRLLVLLNNTTLRNIDTIQKLTDILVSDTANLLDVSSVLRDSLQRVTVNSQLILLVGRRLDGNTIENLHLSNSLLTQEVSDLHVLLSVNLNDVDIDWEMGVDVSQLVLVALGDTGDQVSDQRLDGSQSSDVLSVTIVDGDLDSLVGKLGEGNVNVLQVLLQSTPWTGNSDGSSLDGDRDALRDVENLVGLDVLHGDEIFFCETSSFKDAQIFQSGTRPTRSSV